LDTDKVKLASSLASAKTCLRSRLSTLLQSTLEKNVQNLEILGITAVKIFEIGTVFTLKEGKASEELHLALGVRTKKASSNKEDIKLVEEAKVALGREGFDMDWEVGTNWIETRLEDFLRQCEDPTVYEPVEPLKDFSYKPFSIYPAIVRDLAFWANTPLETTDLIETLQPLTSPFLLRLDLFDTFKKQDRTSYAFRLVFQSKERTLTEVEIEPIMRKVYQKLTDLGYEIR
jgi:phenylalanyl-tRNA synthetase beta subunit